ncbi:hypothetical protein GCM10027079_30200 [Sediminivirga luteola]|uniref:Uncharacterized protein n=1 Tax=Sediminivirga luteola TaxID=1774748 RepID=A0A8J2XLG7_9MICO|nr:hypothetical protein GCM10011333_27290 [Sediminivirga luteola]
MAAPRKVTDAEAAGRSRVTAQRRSRLPDPHDGPPGALCCAPAAAFMNGVANVRDRQHEDTVSEEALTFVREHRPELMKARRAAAGHLLHDETTG